MRTPVIPKEKGVSTVTLSRGSEGDIRVVFQKSTLVNIPDDCGVVEVPKGITIKRY